MNNGICMNTILSQSEKKLIYDEIYSQLNGYYIAAKAKDVETVVNKNEMIYGEILYESLVNLFQKIDFGYDMLFYDLGSGIGNVICFAAMEQKFEKCIGIEIFSTLINESIVSEKKLKEKCKLKHPGVNISEIEWNHSNIMDISFPRDKKCCLFMHCTGFDAMLFTYLQKALASLCKDSLIISLTRPFSCEGYRLLYDATSQCSWGETKVFVQKKEN